MLRAAEEGGIGLETKAAAESAALATRDRKQYGIETHTWREEVRSRAAELGLGAEELDDLFREGSERPIGGLIERDQAAELSLGEHLAGPEGLTAKSNTFDERAVLQEFAASATQGALVSEVRGRAERFAERADVIATSRGEMTTAELVDCERRLIAAAVGRAGEGSGDRRCLARRAGDRRCRASADRGAGDGRARDGERRTRGHRHPGARRHRQDLHRRRAARGL